MSKQHIRNFTLEFPRVLKLAFSFSLVLAISSCRDAGEAPPKTSATRPASTATSESPSHQFAFEDITEDCGIDAVYRNGAERKLCSIVEIVGGGVGLFDLDLDGRLDAFIPGGGTFGADGTALPQPGFLFRQLDELKFRNSGNVAGLDVSTQYTFGCSVGDFNSDGFPDLVVTGFRGLQLFQNNGDGTFAVSTALACDRSNRWGASAAWADFDNDGLLDLYVAHYVDWTFENHPPCNVQASQGSDAYSPRQYDGFDDVLLFNAGDGSFRDASAEAGLKPAGKGLGVLAADFDHDGDTDLYIANDTVPNFMYANDGHGNFAEQALFSGVAFDSSGIPNGSMGIALIDANMDARPDILVTNFENENIALYQQKMAEWYEYASQQCGIVAVGNSFVGFGTVAADFDQDGDEDLVNANGHVHFNKAGPPREQKPLLLENDGTGVFRRVPENSQCEFFSKPDVGRGVASGDINNDGRMDLVISNLERPVRTVVNRCQSAHNWCRIHVVGIESNREAVGGRVIVETNRCKLLRHVIGGGSFASASDKRLLFNWPKDEVFQKMLVHWPNGSVHEFDEIPQNTEFVILESGRILTRPTP